MTEEKIDVKVVSPEEKAWTDIKEKVEQGITNAKREIQINEAIIVLAKKKIAEEQKV